MKKLFVLVTVSVIFLAACSSESNFDKKISSLDQALERNQKCEEYRPLFESRTGERSQTLNVFEIFYSPKKDSCLAVYETGGSLGEYGTRILEDVSSNEKLAEIFYYRLDLPEFGGNNENKTLEQILEFENKVQEYK